MRRAVPALAISAAGLTWLLHSQGVIDTAARGTPTPPNSTTVAPAAGSSPPSAAGRSSTAGSTPTTASSSGAGGTVNGPVVETRFGPVEVEAVVSGGRVTDVKTLEYPNEARRSQAINQQALPILRQEALSAQSANIDTVSGATYTSEAYAQSLQAALDGAGLARS